MDILLYLLLKFVICEEASKKKEKLNLTKEYFKNGLFVSWTVKLNNFQRKIPFEFFFGVKKIRAFPPAKIGQT